MATASEKNVALSRVLDEEAVTEPNTDPAPDPADSTALYAEHMARLRAEAEAADKADRLRVAQEQLAEYAQEKSQAANDVLQQVHLLDDALAALAKSSTDPTTITAAAQHLRRLKDRLAEAAVEARAFADQQHADMERLKRSSEQAELMAVDGGVEMKRPREARVQDSSSEEEEAKPATEDDEEEGSDEGPGRSTGNGASTSYPAGALPSVLRRSQGGAASALSVVRERARYVPLRLKLEERRLLRLLEAALNVSEYTDKVDILTWRSKSARVHAQIRDLCAILSGLVVAQDYKRGQQLVGDREFSQNKAFFQGVFEVGRRYKIQNPEKMRSEYGKLIYLLMDSADPHIQELLEFDCVTPLNTVASFLESRGAGGLLEEPALVAATAEIPSSGRPRGEVQRDIRAKERARETLARKYRSAQLSEEDALWAIYSLADNAAFLAFNRDPIDRMLHYFTTYVRPDGFEPGCSLAIASGREGARLTHSHERQYQYVLQSLTLWREVQEDMFKLWYCAESDMLRPGNGYRLCDTGQGLNRVQAAPAVSKAMHAILARCQARIGSWVGSSVIHLGDHNVPNALFFLNKYTQVPQILNPVVAVLDEVPRVAKEPAAKQYIDAAFGGVEGARKAILLDFCRHAFDGSGAENFFDAGSCIDGRLTSAWNWCSKIEKKPYFTLFKMCGFVSFDGDFK